jgi:hypothetical protein
LTDTEKAKALGLNGFDLRAIAKETGKDFTELPGSEMIYAIAWAKLHKSDPSVSYDDVLALDMTEVAEIADAAAEDLRPIQAAASSVSSVASPPPLASHPTRYAPGR